MRIKAPRLIRNRHGVYYFRVKLGGVEKRVSIRTKYSQTANILALQLYLDIERKPWMSNPLLSDLGFDPSQPRSRYELDLRNGKCRGGLPAQRERLCDRLRDIGEDGKVGAVIARVSV